MSRVIGHPQPQPHVPYASAYYRPAVDRGEYTLHSPGNYMAFPVYPPQHHVHPSHLPYPSNGVVPNGGMGTTTTVYPSRRSRSRSNTHQDKASRSSSRSRPDESNGGGSSHGHSVSDFFSLRRSRSQDSRKSAKSARSGISSKSLGEVVGEVFGHMMNPFRRSKSRDRVYTRGEYLQEGGDWYLPSSHTGNRLVKSQSTRRPARVPTYESAPAPGHLHRSNTTSNIPHHILHQERHRQRDREAEREREREVEREREREGRSRSRTRQFTPAELEDQATTRRGLEDWIDNRMQDKDHSRRQEERANGNNAKMQAFQPTWRASKDYRQNNHTTSLGGVPVSKPLAPLSAKGSSAKAASAVAPNSSYTTTYKYNGYNIRV